MPLPNLQDALTLFLYFVQAILTDISSVSKQDRQSLEAVSRPESTELPLEKLESVDTWCPVLLELPATASSLGSAGPLVGLGEGLGTLVMVVQ